MATIEIWLNKFISEVSDDRLLTKVVTYRSSGSNDMEIIEKAFAAFNGQPCQSWLTLLVERYYAEGNHSLSVSDVVCVDGRAYQCKSVGWTRIPHPFSGL